MQVYASTGNCYRKNHYYLPTLASCCFDKHGLILIIFRKQHQHTFKNDMCAQLSLSLHFYLLYLLLNSCDGNDAFSCHCVFVKQSSSFSRKHRTLSLQICVCQTVRLTIQSFWTDAGTCVHCSNTCLQYQPLWPATWSSTSSTHVQAYHKTSSTKQFVNEESGYVQAWGKWHHFEHLLN